ncbi:MAG TPA: histidine phosphatase family protein [Fimbriimonadaceae bacterium]|nr:histidine phosphatase family protein [Fimbriimonadaceae bacterium]
MRVYLVRHGQTSWNAEGKNQGHTDIPLDESGMEQARLLAGAFDERPFTRLLCSDLQRAWMTAEPLAQRHGVVIETHLSLRERSFGEWEGLPMERVAANFIELGLLHGLAREAVRPPGGESTEDVWNRLTPAVKEIEGCHEPVVVICHGGSGAILLSRLLNANASTTRAFRFSNTGITTLARRPDGGFQLFAYNESGHLRNEALAGTVDGVVR